MSTVQQKSVLLISSPLSRRSLAKLPFLTLKDEAYSLACRAKFLLIGQIALLSNTMVTAFLAIICAVFIQVAINMFTSPVIWMSYETSV